MIKRGVGGSYALGALSLGGPQELKPPSRSRGQQGPSQSPETINPKTLQALQTQETL